MVATLASAATIPFLGRYLDLYSTRRIILFIVPALAAACLSLALSQSLVMLVVSIYALRLFGQGMMMQTALTATARWFVANRGRALSLMYLGYNTSEALFPLMFVSLAAIAGWRGAWILAGACLVAITLPATVALIRGERVPRASDPGPRQALVPDRTRGEALRDPFFYLLLTGMLAPPFIGTTIFFHQIYLVELRGWSLEMFAASFTLMATMNIGFLLLTGYLVDRFSAVRLLPAYLLPLGLGCLMAGYFEAPWSPFLFMGVLGISFGIHTSLFGAVWPEVYGLRHLGSIRAAVFGFMVFCTAVGPGLTGFLIDFGIAYPAQVAAMGVYCLVAMFVMAFVSRRLRARLLETGTADG
jgi:MFS family permease